MCRDTLLTLFSRILCLTSDRSPFVNTKPTLPRMCGISLKAEAETCDLFSYFTRGKLNMLSNSHHFLLLRDHLLRHWWRSLLCVRCQSQWVQLFQALQLIRSELATLTIIFITANHTWFLTFYTSLGNTINKTMTYFSSAAFCSRWPRMAFLIMVFLPMRTTAWPRRDIRIVCICLLPTLSTPTRKHLGYSSSNCWKIVKHTGDNEALSVPTKFLKY